MIKLPIYSDTGWINIANNVIGRKVNDLVIITFNNYVCTTQGWQYQFALPSGWVPKIQFFGTLYINDTYASLRMLQIVEGCISIHKPDDAREELLGSIAYFV